MTNNLVSIIVPAYNAEKFIAEAIESALAQTYPHWELLVVDDGSQDNTAKIVGRFKDRRICLVQQPNGGEAAARNAALDLAKGEWIAFLDADDLYEPDHLEVAVGYLIAHREFNAVYTNGSYINSTGERLQTLSSRRRGPFEGWIFPEIVRGPDVFGPPGCVILNSEPIQQDHLRFDRSIGYGTDWDFFANFAEKNQFGYVEKRTYLYRVHQSNMTKAVDPFKRSASWVKCRTKAIKLPGFSACPTDIRWEVFYDLLIAHLNGFPAEQEAVTRWQEFNELPRELQANLLRLMASNGILIGTDKAYILNWFNRSRELRFTDPLTFLLLGLYKGSPKICSIIISSWRQPKEKAPNPTIFNS